MTLWRDIRIILILLATMIVFSRPTTAQSRQVSVEIGYWPDVTLGMAQSYNVRITPTNGAVHSAYVIAVVHPDTNVVGVNHTAGLDCHTFDKQPVTVFCVANVLTQSQTVGIHGGITGDGDGGRYAIVRVGTIENGSPGAGWVLESNYYGNGTIPDPTSLEPAGEPKQYRVYLDSVMTNK